MTWHVFVGEEGDYTLHEHFFDTWWKAHSWMREHYRTVWERNTEDACQTCVAAAQEEIQLLEALHEGDSFEGDVEGVDYIIHEVKQ